MKLTDFKVLTFDCYGTLIDWESGMIAALQTLTSRVGGGLRRNQVLEAHARHESSQQHWTPCKRYSDLLSIVYKRLAEEWGVAVSLDECEAYGNSVGEWPAFADSVEALRYLKEHYKLVILSNVDNRSFNQSAQRLQVSFDAVFTAEDIGSYKPSERNFHYMSDKLAFMGINKSQILHTAESLFHDHVPANRHQLATCWIYRRHDQSGFGATMDPGQKPEINFKFNSMADLADAHRQAVSG